MPLLSYYWLIYKWKMYIVPIDEMAFMVARNQSVSSDDKKLVQNKCLP